MRTGTMTEYAAHRGVSKAYVSKLQKEKRLVMVKLNGRAAVDFDRSDQVLMETSSPAHGHAGRNSPPTSAARVAAGAKPVDGVPGAHPGSVSDSLYRRAQAKEKGFNAMLAEIAYRREVGEVLDRAVVERTVFDLFRTLRDQAFQAPQRAALRVRGQADVRAIEDVIADELRKSFDSWEAKMAARLAPARPRS
jgi:hypothetical protein